MAFRGLQGDSGSELHWFDEVAVLGLGERARGRRIAQGLSDALTVAANCPRRPLTGLGVGHWRRLQAAAMDVLLALEEQPLDRLYIMPASRLTDRAAWILVTSITIAQSMRRMLSRAPGRVLADLRPLAYAASFGSLALFEASNAFEGGNITAQAREIASGHPAQSADRLPESVGYLTRAILHEIDAGRHGLAASLPSARLHVFSLILKVAEAFVDGCMPAPIGVGRSPGRHLYEMTHGPARHTFDPIVVAALHQAVGVFETGSVLEFADGVQAKIIGYLNNGQALDPWMRMCDRTDTQPFRLSDRPDLTPVDQARTETSYLCGEPLTLRETRVESLFSLLHPALARSTVLRSQPTPGPYRRAGE